MVDTGEPKTTIVYRRSSQDEDEMIFVVPFSQTEAACLVAAKRIVDSPPFIRGVYKRSNPERQFSNVVPWGDDLADREKVLYSVRLGVERLDLELENLNHRPFFPPESTAMLRGIRDNLAQILSPKT